MFRKQKRLSEKSLIFWRMRIKYEEEMNAPVDMRKQFVLSIHIKGNGLRHQKSQIFMFDA